MKNRTIIRKIALRGAYLFIGMLLAFIISGKAFAGNGRMDQYYGPVGLKLSGQSGASDRVTASAYIIDEKAYYDLVGQGDLLYCWDSEVDDEKVNVGREYEIKSNGRHYLNVYISGENGNELYCTMEFDIDNIDTAAPSFGNLTKIPDSGMWRIRAEGCSDDRTSSENLRFCCISYGDAEKYRSGNGWDTEGLLRNEGSRNSEFTVEEGKYCYFVIDEALNAAEMDIETGHLDTEPPYFTGEPVLYNEGGANGFANAVVVSVKAADDEALNPYPYSFDDGKTWRDNCDMRVTENCRIIIRVRDAAGNEGEPVTVNIDNIDNELPKLSLSQEDAGNDGIRVKVHAEDGISGVNEISYMEEGSAIPAVLAGGKGSFGRSKDGEVLLKKNGTYIFSVKDAALNITTEKVSIVRTVAEEKKESSQDKKTPAKKETKAISSADGVKKDESVKKGQKESRQESAGEKTKESTKETAKDYTKDNTKDSTKESTKESTKDSAKESKKDSIKDNKKESPGSTEKTFYGSNAGKTKDNKSHGKTKEYVKTIYVSEGLRPAESSSADKVNNISTVYKGNESGVKKYTSYAKKEFTKDEEEEDYEDDEKGSVSSDMKYDVYRLDEDEDTDITGTEEEITEAVAEEAVTEDRGKEISDEELLPGILNEDAERKGISVKTGKVIMVAAILLILTALTFVLLIRFKILRLPELSEEEEAVEQY